MSSNGSMKKYNNAKDLLSEEQQDILRSKSVKIERLQSEIMNLSKPFLQSESYLNWSKHVTPGTLAVFQDERSWNGISGVNLERKSNVKEFKDVNGMSWNTMKEIIQTESEDDSFSEGGSPSTTQLDVKDMKLFGAMPMEEEIVIVKCNNCQRPMLPSQFKEHSDSCFGSKGHNDSQDRRSNSKGKGIFSDDEEIDPKKSIKKKKRAILLEEELNTPTTTAKRPPSASLEKNEKKKSRKDKQKKTIKQKAPLDLDKQCGVVQGQNNMPCTRSLTCKSHSMGAKRAVEGRSLLYDVLLAAYQKKSIGRPNASAVGSTIQAVGSTTTEKSIKNLKRLHQSQNSSTAASLNGDASSHNYHNIANSTHQTNEEAFVDSDEEVENVMQALRFSRPTPLAQKPFFFVKRRRQCHRLRDILLDSITPKISIPSSTTTSVTNNTNNAMMRQAFFQQQQGYNSNNTAANEDLFEMNGPSGALFSVR